METKYAWIIAAVMLAVCSCSGENKNPYGGNGTYGMIENEREFGVVLSTQVGNHLAITGVGQAIAGAQYNNALTQGASAASTAVGGTMLSPLSNVFNTGAAGLQTSNSATADIAVQIHYVIRKDNGQQVTIDQDPEINEPINYPGQRVMLQRNGDYIRVYPADEENPLDENLDRSSAPRSRMR